MRRKSEKGKEKENPEKKLVRRSSRRNSKRKKRSHSSSPEDEDSGDETSVKCEDGQEENSTRDGSVESERKGGTSSGGKLVADMEEEWQEDNSFWTDDTAKEESSDVQSDKNHEKSLWKEDSRIGDDESGLKLEGAKPEEGDRFEPKSRRERRTRRRSNADEGECATVEKLHKVTVDDENPKEDETSGSGKSELESKIQVEGANNETESNLKQLSPGNNNERNELSEDSVQESGDRHNVDSDSEPSKKELPSEVEPNDFVNRDGKDTDSIKSDKSGEKECRDELVSKSSGVVESAGFDRKAESGVVDLDLSKECKEVVSETPTTDGEQFTCNSDGRGAVVLAKESPESEEESGEIERRASGCDTPSSNGELPSPTGGKVLVESRKGSKGPPLKRTDEAPISEKPRRIKLFRASRDSTGSNTSETVPRQTSPRERTYERIQLRRSFNSDNVTQRKSSEQSEGDRKENKENTHQSTGKVEISSAGSLSRKRRWASSKISQTKKPVLSISSDSLKNLVPGAKPLSAKEVQMSEEETSKEDVKNEIADSWLPKPSGDEKDLMRPFVMLPETPNVPPSEDHGKLLTRKISIPSDLQRSPSPPRHSVSDILYITNLVRPFTVNQLKDLLARTGNIIEGGFWIDKIKSRCYVQYENEEQAKETRHALHGVRWPVSNPKQLCVDFGRREDMEVAQATSEAEQIPRKTEPLQQPAGPSPEQWVREQPRPEERPRPHKVPPAVREWDLGKVGQLSPARESRTEERTKDRERKMRKEKVHRSRSSSPVDVSVRKLKKKDDDAPAKLLDDLFRKTKTTPCIYWLPLTAEQIVVKEEMRRKHMAEHERRMAEMRKVERERERARAQQRAPRRSGRRRSTSGSPKK